MNTLTNTFGKLWLMLVLFLSSGVLLAQDYDDLYYSPSETDTFVDEQGGNVYIENNYYYDEDED